MIFEPMDILKLYPIRRSKGQKQGFRNDIRMYASGLGYPVTFEQGKRGVQNVIIGNPQSAEYLITAHYDTPASSIFPNLLIPENHFLFFLYQMAIILCYMLVALLIGFPVYLYTNDSNTGFLAWYLTYMALVMLQRLGPANRQNANDNTSGVVTVLETAASLPERYRQKVCFILFDQEEKGLVGSAAYRDGHKDEIQTQIVLNMDCVGDGDTILFEPVKSAKVNEALMARLSSVCGTIGKKELRVARCNCTGSSDHKKFPNGVGVKALRYQKGIGLYCGRIHTNRDTILDYTNVNILRAALISMICTADTNKEITSKG